jgi:hypothetical protein
VTERFLYGVMDAFLFKDATCFFFAKSQRQHAGSVLKVAVFGVNDVGRRCHGGVTWFFSQCSILCFDSTRMVPEKKSHLKYICGGNFLAPFCLFSIK